MEIKGIIFDKDGVLVDFQKTYAPSTVEVIAALAENDPELSSRMADAVDFDLEAVRFGASSVVIAGSAADIAATWLPLLDSWKLPALIEQLETLYDELTVKHVKSFEDVGSSLTALKAQGLKLGLATNDTQESANRHLDTIGHKHFFDSISGYDSGYGAKPGPGMVLNFAKTFGLNANDVIMVGDSTHDMQAGRAAGAVCVAITTGLADAETLAPHADHVVDSLTELADLAISLRSD